ncbi:MAG TPA: carboxylesterase/lipase family protein [Bryobacteraceae bacterium]|nr:carboxylesterase/lipase family protein [Bryobacteraceae bacterium]
MHSTANAFGRRAWMKGAAAAALAPASPALAAPRLAEPGCETTIATDASAITETTAGKVRGFTRNGIYTFKGIPYAASTAGAARFLPPAKAKPWTGVRSCMYYGPVCPQVERTGWANDEVAWLFNWDDGQPGEDCLRLNIWTPALKDNRKRPVMVWLHGGGFVAGSGQEHPGYNGENLSRRGDVVVVTINHRLGVLGYLNLAELGGEKYVRSANAGMLDIVACLEWVRDNIGNFGGDPSNVTIFGQSGGGAKVTALMAMPSAKGLFHRAIVQSGSSLRMARPENTAKLAAATLSELGVSPSQIGRLHEIPAAQLIAAGSAALKKLTPAGPPAVRVAMADRIGWAPTVDGEVLPHHPFDPTAPPESSSVPLMVGTTLNEFTTALGNPEMESMTEEEMTKRVTTMYGDRAGRIIEAYRKTHPRAKPLDILSYISTAPVRQNAVTQAERKAAQGGAPAYLYLFAWQTPVLDGRPRAFHCAEIAFAFYNTDVSATMTGGGPEPRALAAKVSDAWINFARSGNPNHPGLPKWPAYAAGQGATMIFDKKCEVKSDPDREERALVIKA